MGIGRRRNRLVQPVAPDTAFGSRLKGWYDDTTLVNSSGVVSAWNDKSGSARHLTQGTVGRRPFYLASWRNGKPALQGDGTQRYVFGALGATFSQPNTFFVVGRAPNPTTAAGTRSALFDGFTSTKRNHAYLLPTAGQANRISMYAGTAVAAPALSAAPFQNGVGAVVRCTFDTTASILDINGVVASKTLSVGTQAIDTLYVASAYDQTITSWLVGEIAELIFVNGAITETEAAQVTTWLRTKWSL